MAGDQRSRLWPLAVAAALVMGCQSSGQFRGNDRESGLGGPTAAATSTDAPTAAASSSVQQAAAIAPVVESPSNTGSAAAATPEVLPSPPHPIPQALELSLFDAVELGLAQNPDLVALRYAQGVGEEAVGVAETYPFNPWVQIQVTPFQQSATANTGPTKIGRASCRERE